MPTRRSCLALASAAAVATLLAAAAPLTFAMQQFEGLKAKGGPVLIHVHASWCPTCRAQQPILRKLLDEPEFKDFVAFEVDYDKEKKPMVTLAAPFRSTIIVYRNGQEVGRSIGDTEEGGIKALMEKAL